MRGVYIQKNSPYYWIRFYNKFEEDPRKRRKSFNTKIPVTPSDRKRAEEAHKKGNKAKLIGNAEIRKFVREFQQGWVEWSLKKGAGFSLKKDIKLSEGFEEFKVKRSIPGSKKLLTKKTLRNYELAVTHMINACGDKYIFKYKETDYVKLLYYFEERELSTNARANYTRSLHAVWNFFLDKKYTLQNIIEVIPPEEKDPEPIPVDELRSILNYFRRDEKFPHHFWIIYFLLLTGARPSSAMSQLKEDIDFKKKIISIPNIKTGKRKGKLKYKFPLYKELEKLIREIGVEEGDTGRLFDMFALIPDNYTWPLSFWRRGINFLFIGGVLSKKYTVKQLRSTTASFLINELKLPIFTVKRLLDHSNIKVTDKHYVDLSISKIRKEMDVLTYDDFIDDVLE